jgi:hypothetical protein
MRRMMVWLLGLGAATLLSLEGCSAERVSSSDASARRVAAAQDGDEKPDKQKKEAAAEPFKLPDDRGGQLLGRVLPPRIKAGSLGRPDRPAPPTAPAPKFVQPPATLPPSTALVSRAPAPPKKDKLRPRLVIDESLDGATEPVLPRSPSFEAQKLTAVPSEDVSIPPPLPILAQPTLDRVSFDDATTEASTEAALMAPLPRRVTPAPFVRSGVPEPFENRKPLTTKSPDEETAPVVDGPALPK